MGGLSGSVDDSVINCTVQNSTILGSSNWVGGLSGSVDGSIINCSVKNSNIQGLESFVGGLVGDGSGGIASLSFVNNSIVTGNSYIGGLIGYHKTGNINSCFVLNSTINGTSQYVGGFVGLLSGSISKSGVIANVSGSNTVGGLVGSLKGYISDCYVSGRISGNEAVGGLVGRLGGVPGSSDTFTSNCYVVGTVNGTSVDTGGVAGYIGGAFDVDSGGVISSVSLIKFVNSNQAIPYRLSNYSYYTVSLLLQNNYAWSEMTSNGELFTTEIGPNKRNGASISTDEFWNNQSFFEDTLGWDFENTWKMNSGNDKYQLPVLQFQTTPVTVDASYLLGEEAEPTPTPTPTPTPEKPEAPTLTPPVSLPEDAEETTNTVAETSAATKAEVGYQVSPTDITEMKAPSITRGSLSVMLNDKVKVTKKLADGTEEEVEAEVLEDGSVRITGSLDDAESVTVNFIGRQFGDVTNDDKVDLSDAISALRVAAELDIPTDKETFYMDVSADSEIDLDDSILLLRFAAELVDENYVTKA